MSSDPAARPGTPRAAPRPWSTKPQASSATRESSTAPQAPIATPSPSGTRSAADGVGVDADTRRSAETATPVRPLGADLVSSEGAAASGLPNAAVVTAVPQPGAGAVRKARLTLAQIDPWSVMKMTFVLSIAAGIVLVVAVWLLWVLLAGGGVFVSIDRTVGDITGSGSSISIVEIFSLRRVMGIALMLSVVQVVLITALATLGAFLYNLAAGLVGGVEVTLAEDS